MKAQFLASIDEIIESKVNDGIYELLFNLQEEISKLGENDYDRKNKITTIQKGILDELSFEQIAWLFIRFSRLKDDQKKKFFKLFEMVIKKTKAIWLEFST